MFIYKSLLLIGYTIKSISNEVSHSIINITFHKNLKHLSSNSLTDKEKLKNDFYKVSLDVKNSTEKFAKEHNLNYARH